MDLSGIFERLSRSAFLARKNAHQCLTYGLSPQGARQHVFVAGVQRSGTNMVMDVLERSMQTAVFHESDPRAFSGFLMRDRSVIHKLAERSRAPCFVVKALCESQEVRELLDQFAPAKAVWVFRNYHDVVNSMLRSFKEHAVHINKIARERNSAGWRGRGMSDETHGVIRRFAHPELDDTSGAALMWYLRNVLYFELGLNLEPRTILVRYEALVTEPNDEFRRLFQFLELDYSPELSAFVTPGSVSRRPAPALAAELEALCRSMHERLLESHRRQR